jgi:hypothetical protein
MALTGFEPKFKVQEGQSANSFKIWDESTWAANDPDVDVDLATLRLFFYDTEGELLGFDDYELIRSAGADKTRWTEYLSIDGHEVPIDELVLDGETLLRFVDGYYIVRILYNDSTYGAGSEPYYDNHQGFLAQHRCMMRKLPIKLLTWPDLDYNKNQDIHRQRMFLDAAEDCVDLGKKVQFEEYIRVINNIYDKYEITECF